MVVILGPLQRGATQRLASGVSRQAVCRDGGGDSRVDTLARRSSGVRRSRRDKTAVFGSKRSHAQGRSGGASGQTRLLRPVMADRCQRSAGTLKPRETSAGTPHQDKRR
jgi:hypothetical protein